MKCPACGLVHCRLMRGFGESPTSTDPACRRGATTVALEASQTPGPPVHQRPQQPRNGHRHGSHNPLDLPRAGLSRPLGFPGLLHRAASEGGFRGFNPLTKAAACAYVALHARDNPRCLSEVTEVGECNRDRLAKSVSRVRIGTSLGPLGPAEWDANTSRLTNRYCAELDLSPATATYARRIGNPSVTADATR